MRKIYYTRYTPEESIQRIKKRLEEDVLTQTYKAYFNSDLLSHIYYKKLGNHIRLRTMRSASNSFAPYFYGTFYKTAEGAKLIGEFRMRSYTRIVMYCWFGFLLFIMLTTLIFGFTTPAGENQTNPFQFLFLLLVMLGFGFILTRIGIYQGKKDEEIITAFLVNTLKAVYNNEDELT